MNWLRASTFNFERLDKLRDSIRHPSKKLLSFEFDTSFRFQFGASLDKLRHSVGHPSKKLLSFEFSKSFRFQFGASRYITGLNQTSVYKVIVISICSELLVSILSVSIYYPIQSDIRVKSYCRLNFLRASVFNLEHLDILPDSTGHPCIKLLSFQFS